MPRSIYQDDHKKIVERLKQARLEANLNQVEVAKKLGKTQSYISKIESGQRRFDVLQLKDFAKFVLKESTILEQRSVLGCISSELVLKNGKVLD